MMQKTAKFILFFLISTEALSYNQLNIESRAPHRKWGLSFGLGLAGNGFGVKPELHIAKSIALVMPLTASVMLKTTVFKREISLHRIHWGLGFKWHVGEHIDRDAFFIEPVFSMGFTQILKEQYFAYKPSLSVGYSWVWDSGIIFSLGLTGEFEFFQNELGESTKKLREDNVANFLLINQPAGVLITIGWLF